MEEADGSNPSRSTTTFQRLTAPPPESNWSPNPWIACGAASASSDSSVRFSRAASEPSRMGTSESKVPATPLLPPRSPAIRPCNPLGHTRQYLQSALQEGLAPKLADI